MLCLLSGGPTAERMLEASRVQCTQVQNTLPLVGLCSGLMVRLCTQAWPHFSLELVVDGSACKPQHIAGLSGAAGRTFLLKVQHSRTVV